MSALVSMEDRKKLLNDVWLFHGATDEELTMLAERAYEVSVGPQVDIVTQHEFGDELFLVVDGHAAVSRDGVDLGVVNAGDFFGEMALLGTGVRTSSVRSIVAITLLGLRAEHFDEVLTSDPMVARRVLSVVVMRLEATNRRLSELEGRRPSTTLRATPGPGPPQGLHAGGLAEHRGPPVRVDAEGGESVGGHVGGLAGAGVARRPGGPSPIRGRARAWATRSSVVVDPGAQLGEALLDGRLIAPAGVDGAGGQPGPQPVEVGRALVVLDHPGGGWASSPRPAAARARAVTAPQ